RVGIRGFGFCCHPYSLVTVTDHFADPAAAKLLGEISILLQFPTRARQSVPGTSVLSFLLPFYSQVNSRASASVSSTLHRPHSRPTNPIIR
ncbi:unnamed protein product, partial [Linum tenue]